MNTKLVDKFGKIIEIPYYEVEDYFKEKCLEYTLESKEHELLFNEFSKNYTNFNPYFDFALFNLHYKIINPLFEIGKIEYVSNNRLVINNLTDYMNEIKSKTSYNYKKVSEIEVTQINPYKINASVVDQEGNCYLVNRQNNEYHDYLFEELLEQIIISNKEVCIDFYEKVIRDKTIPNINFYFRDRLGYIQISENYVLYNKDLLNEDTKIIIKTMKEEYSNREYIESDSKESELLEIRELIDSTNINKTKRK